MAASAHPAASRASLRSLSTALCVSQSSWPAAHLPGSSALPLVASATARAAPRSSARRASSAPPAQHTTISTSSGARPPPAAPAYASSTHCDTRARYLPPRSPLTASFRSMCASPKASSFGGSPAAGMPAASRRPRMSCTEPFGPATTSARPGAASMPATLSIFGWFCPPSRALRTAPTIPASGGRSSAAPLPNHSRYDSQTSRSAAGPYTSSVSRANRARTALRASSAGAPAPPAASSMPSRRDSGGSSSSPYPDSRREAHAPRMVRPSLSRMAASPGGGSTISSSTARSGRGGPPGPHSARPPTAVVPSASTISTRLSALRGRASVTATMRAAPARLRAAFAHACLPTARWAPTNTARPNWSGGTTPLLTSLTNISAVEQTMSGPSHRFFRFASRTFPVIAATERMPASSVRNFRMSLTILRVGSSTSALLSAVPKCSASADATNPYWHAAGRISRMLPPAAPRGPALADPTGPAASPAVGAIISPPRPPRPLGRPRTGGAPRSRTASAPGGRLWDWPGPKPCTWPYRCPSYNTRIRSV